MASFDFLLSVSSKAQSGVSTENMIEVEGSTWRAANGRTYVELYDQPALLGERAGSLDGRKLASFAAPSSFSSTDANVTLTRGSRRARLAILPALNLPAQHADAYDDADQEDLEPGDAKVISVLREFVDDNALHVWPMSVRVKDGYAYATNNVSMIRVKLDWPDGTYPFFFLDAVLAAIREHGSRQHMTVAVNARFAILTGQDFRITCRQFAAPWSDKEFPWPDFATLGVEPIDGKAVFHALEDLDGETVELAPEGLRVADQGGEIIDESVHGPGVRIKASLLKLVAEHASRIFLLQGAPCHFELERVSGRGIFVTMVR